ncbi:MAG: hypothetical protein FJ242_09535 [Nitrospira sp.]|nr:hypothetical protein [Nitrospira sp.]
MSFRFDIFKRLVALIKRIFPEVPAEILLKTSQYDEKGIPDYIVSAFKDDSDGYLTPYQVALYHPLADEKLRSAMMEAMAEVERLIEVGWLKVSEMLCPLRKVMIPDRIYKLLEQEFRVAEGEKKERLCLLHGRIQADRAYVEDLTDNVLLEEKGFFKGRDFMGMSFTVKAHQMIGKNLNKWLNLSKTGIIGTYHTHLIPFRRNPSLKDMALLMANPGMPHLILCRLGLFAYTFKSFRRVFSMTFPKRIPLEIIQVNN